MIRFGRVPVVALIVGLTAFAAGCGGGSDNNSKAGNASSGGGKAGLKVGFVYVSPLPGSAWSAAWDQTRKDLVQKFGAQTTVVQPIAENPDLVGVLEDLIRKGDKLIFATAFGYQPFVAQVAKQHPDVDFVVTGPWAQTQPLPSNVAAVYGSLWQVRYLTGIVAGSMSKSNKLGFVSAHTIPDVVAGINAFELGAQSVDPSATTRVVLTNTWYDPPKGTQAAETLAKAGADVIAKHVDDNGPLLGAKAAGALGIGSEADTSAAVPDTYLTGSVWDWRKYAEKKYQQAKSGSFKSENFTGSLQDGTVKLGPFNSKVPSSVQEKVKSAEQKLESGEAVFKGPLKSNTGKVMLPAGQSWTTDADIGKNMTFFVDGVIGKIQG